MWVSYDNLWVCYAGSAALILAVPAWFYSWVFFEFLVPGWVWI